MLVPTVNPGGVFRGCVWWWHELLFPPKNHARFFSTKNAKNDMFVKETRNPLCWHCKKDAYSVAYQPHNRGAIHLSMPPTTVAAKTMIRQDKVRENYYNASTFPHSRWRKRWIPDIVLLLHLVHWFLIMVKKCDDRNNKRIIKLKYTISKKMISPWAFFSTIQVRKEWYSYQQDE